MPDPPSVIAPKPLYALSGVAARLTHQRFASRGVELRLRSSVDATANARVLVSARDARRLGVKSRVLARTRRSASTAGATELAALRARPAQPQAQAHDRDRDARGHDRQDQADEEGGAPPLTSYSEVTTW